MDWNALHNEITIQIPSKKEREKDNVVCVVRDKGLSIAKDYDYDINKFIKADKRHINKEKKSVEQRKERCWYVPISKTCRQNEIVSQDTDHKSCLQVCLDTLGREEEKKSFHSLAMWNTVRKHQKIKKSIKFSLKGQC